MASYAIPTIIVPLVKLPLNPNGKVDKPKLPFPDTAQLAAVAKLSVSSHDAQAAEEENLTKLEEQIRDLWLDVLPNRPATISKDDSFFDLGGHSILGTRMIFELRKKLNVEIPLGVIFKNPTVEQFAKEVEKVIKGGQDFQLADEGKTIQEENKDVADSQSENLNYAEDAKELSKSALLESYSSLKQLPSGSINVLLLVLQGSWVLLLFVTC